MSATEGRRTTTIAPTYGRDLADLLGALYRVERRTRRIKAAMSGLPVAMVGADADGEPDTVPDDSPGDDRPWEAEGTTVVDLREDAEAERVGEWARRRRR